MDRDRLLREQLKRLLDWQDAHANFDQAIKGIDPASRGKVPKGMAHSAWQLLEHLRLTQFDILDFCRNPDYEEPSSMEEYWPSSPVPPSKGAWDKSVAAYRRDLEELKKLAMDRQIDLFSHVPQGSGQTFLRELVLVADHTAYHVGQLVAVRRALDDWRS